MCAGLLLTAAVLLSGIVLLVAIGLILWRNSRAVCPECGYDPIEGNVGWTRESVILWILLFACVLKGAWTTFWISMAVMWIFTPVFG